MANVKYAEYCTKLIELNIKRVTTWDGLLNYSATQIWHQYLHNHNMHHEIAIILMDMDDLFMGGLIMGEIYQFNWNDKTRINHCELSKYLDTALSIENKYIELLSHH